jgi:arylsulfatase A-like enzyme
LDSVALADRTLGRLRQKMEQAGLWDRTAILVSADHGWRTNTWRNNPEWTSEEEAASHQDTSGVPFLLKLPGETSGIAYNDPFNTIVTRQLLTGILNGQLTESSSLPSLIVHTAVR